MGLDGANDDPAIDSADPFGIREMDPETEAVDGVIAKARRQSVKKRWNKAGKSFRKGFGVAQESSRAFLTRSPYVAGWNIGVGMVMEHRSAPKISARWPRGTAQ